MQEKIDSLEKGLFENTNRINSIENSVTPLFDKMDKSAEKMDKLTEAMIKNTASHQEISKMQERIIKRQDKLDDELKAVYEEVATSRPAIKLMNTLGLKMTYFGLFMITVSVTALVVVAKGGFS